MPKHHLHGRLTMLTPEDIALVQSIIDSSTFTFSGKSIESEVANLIHLKSSIAHLKSSIVSCPPEDFNA